MEVSGIVVPVTVVPTMVVPVTVVPGIIVPGIVNVSVIISGPVVDGMSVEGPGLLLPIEKELSLEPLVLVISPMELPDAERLADSLSVREDNVSTDDKAVPDQDEPLELLPRLTWLEYPDAEGVDTGLES